MVTARANQKTNLLYSCVKLGYVGYVIHSKKKRCMSFLSLTLDMFVCPVGKQASKTDDPLASILKVSRKDETPVAKQSTVPPFSLITSLSFQAAVPNNLKRLLLF